MDVSVAPAAVSQLIVQEQTLVAPLEQLGCWLTPACQRASCQVLHHHHCHGGDVSIDG